MKKIVLNFRKQGDSFSSYAAAFYRAATNLKTDLDCVPSYRDTDACPIFYLYRHAIELYMKHVCHKCADISLLLQIQFEESKCCNVLKKHDLRQLWDLIKVSLNNLDYISRNEITGVDKIMESIIVLDPNSFCFRYPKKKDGTAYLKKKFTVCVDQVVENMEKACEILDAYCCMVDSNWDDTCESYQLLEGKKGISTKE